MAPIGHCELFRSELFRSCGSFSGTCTGGTGSIPTKWCWSPSQQGFQQGTAVCLVSTSEAFCLGERMWKDVKGESFHIQGTLKCDILRVLRGLLRRLPCKDSRSVDEAVQHTLVLCESEKKSSLEKGGPFFKAKKSLHFSQSTLLGRPSVTPSCCSFVKANYAHYSTARVNRREPQSNSVRVFPHSACLPESLCVLVLSPLKRNHSLTWTTLITTIVYR